MTWPPLKTGMGMDAIRSLVAATLLFALTAQTHSFAAQDAAAPSSAADGASSVAGGLNVDMKLDELVKQDVLVPGLSTPVTTVDRQESTIGRSPAAVFVITNEMIKRSGARNVPEALRLAARKAMVKRLK